MEVTTLNFNQIRKQLVVKEKMETPTFLCVLVQTENFNTKSDTQQSPGLKDMHKNDACKKSTMVNLIIIFPESIATTLNKYLFSGATPVDPDKARFFLNAANKLWYIQSDKGCDKVSSKSCV